MLSVVVIAKNEEANIRRCLESVLWADEIIVLDSGSRDHTVNIAKEYTDKVYTSDASEWRGFGVQKQRALSYATSSWILNLDADEFVDERLKQALIRATTVDEADAYRIAIRMYFYGKTLRYSSSPKRHIRLFKREGASYSHDIVHEKIILPKAARIRQLQEPIMHHSFQDISHVLYKMNRYSSYSAKIRISEKRTASLLKTLIGTGWMFFRCFFVQRGFLDGREGFLLAFFSAQGTFYRGVKQLYPDHPEETYDGN
ncbi:MAG: glycosyltransferase family 2 protein [Legionellales bacterium]|nr:glycosyltransferase family 2 protein [Legionellales bacterium]